jgi:hypothetical protein
MKARRCWRWCSATAAPGAGCSPTTTIGSRPPALNRIAVRKLWGWRRRSGPAEAQRAIETLRADLARCGEATRLFGQDNRQALAGILGAIEQTFDGQPLYPTAHLRAAHLLYKKLMIRLVIALLENYGTT